MSKLNVSSSFVNLVEDIMTWEFHDDARKMKNRPFQFPRSVFWDKIYQGRPWMDEEFKTFLNANTQLLYLTGPIGAGKSTFVHYMFEKARLCTGLVIDMSLYSNVFKEFPNNGRGALNDVVRISYEYALQKNIIDCCSDIKDQYRNVKYDQGFRKTSENEDLGDKRRLVWMKVTLEAIKEAPTDRFGALLSEHFKGKYSFSDTEEEIIQKEGFLDDAHFIYSKLNWDELLILYHRLDDTGLPHLLVFDNSDRLLDGGNNSDYVSNVRDLVQEINARPLALPDDKKIKAVICMREERTNYLVYDFGAGDRPMHLSLGMEEPRTSQSLENRQIILRNMMNARLEQLEHIDKEGNDLWYRQYRAFIEKFWLRDTVSSPLGDTPIGSIRIKELCNGSLREILDVAHRSTLDVLSIVERNQCDIDFTKDEYDFKMVRGHLIRTAWHIAGFYNILGEFAQNLHNKKRHPACCLLRILLTYLNNLDEEHIHQNFSKLLDDFQDVFDYSEKEYKEALYKLFFPHTIPGELVSIQQKKTVLNFSDISGDSAIQIKPKGKVFLDHLIISLDFYGLAVTNERNDSAKKLLHERNLEEAYEYLISIYEFVRELESVHYRIWFNNIIPRLDLKKGDKPFERYAKKFAKKDAFHLYRVCDNHCLTIKTYLAEIIKAPEDMALLINPEEKEKIRQDVSRYYQPENALPSSDMPDSLLKEIGRGFPKDHWVKKIVRIFEEYRKMYNRLRELKNEAYTPMGVSSPEFSEKVKKLIGDGQFDRVFPMMEEAALPYKDIYNQLIVNKNRLSALDRENIQIGMERDQYAIEYNRITRAFLTLVDDVLKNNARQ